MITTENCFQHNVPIVSMKIKYITFKFPSAKPSLELYEKFSSMSQNDFTKYCADVTKERWKEGWEVLSSYIVIGLWALGGIALSSLVFWIMVETGAKKNLSKPIVDVLGFIVVAVFIVCLVGFFILLVEFLHSWMDLSSAVGVPKDERDLFKKVKESSSYEDFVARIEADKAHDAESIHSPGLTERGLTALNNDNTFALVVIGVLSVVGIGGFLVTTLASGIYSYFHKESYTAVRAAETSAKDIGKVKKFVSVSLPLGIKMNLQEDWRVDFNGTYFAINAKGQSTRKLANTDLSKGPVVIFKATGPTRFSESPDAVATITVQDKLYSFTKPIADATNEEIAKLSTPFSLLNIMSDADFKKMLRMERATVGSFTSVALTFKQASSDYGNHFQVRMIVIVADDKVLTINLTYNEEAAEKWSAVFQRIAASIRAE
ncbi:MAG: hypothetical protein ACAI35_09820 [Candidatus Methylacidiphilales bacterium]|nr:hypothetical protein [Candidatus Methylacidiphilales bacterium]